MNKKKAMDFLSDKSIFDLERSKGADFIKFIPERIQSYQKDVKYYANQVSIIEDMSDEKLKRLREIEAQKGLKYLLHSKQINSEKLALSASIAQLEKNIQDLKNKIDMFNKLVAEENEKLNSIKQEIFAAGLTLEDIEAEYQRLHIYLEAKSRGEIIEPAVNKKNDRIEQNKKSYSQKSAIDRFNIRMQKHNEMTQKKDESQPGNN